MRGPFIFLCPEVSRNDAYAIAEWLGDGEVTRYLTDDGVSSAEIERLLERVNLPVLTHLFNGGGRFYMAYENKSGRPVGFARLAEGKSEGEAEIVVVIGESGRWGAGLGSDVIAACLRLAFYELRKKRVVAKIHKENLRSLRAFKKAGFKILYESGHLIIYTITAEEYMSSALNTAAKYGGIFITETDCGRLKKIISDIFYHENAAKDRARELESELSRAGIVDPKLISDKTVTMNSKVLLSLDGEERSVTLVYPTEADVIENKISILSPIGTAILGYDEGSLITWEVPAGNIEIFIKKILYQPEAAGDYHL